MRIPISLANQRAFINIKFSENVPVALADATIEFDFCYQTTILVRGKPMKKAAVVFSTAANSGVEAGALSTAHYRAASPGP